MEVSNQLLLTFIKVLILTTAGKTCSITIYTYIYNLLSIIIIFAAQAQFGCFADPGCIGAVVGPSNAEDFVSIMMQDCITMMVVNASSA